MSDHGHCDALKSPSYLNFGLSLVIFLGILISYLPQHYRIIARHSSEGISPYFVLLGATSSVSAFANIITLPSSRADVACCSEINGFACFAAILGVLQVGLQCLCFTIILFLFLIFFPRTISLTPPTDSTPSYRTAVTTTAIGVIYGLVTAIASIVLILRYPSHLQAYANVLGILATALGCLQYLPQLYTTWRLKHVGSLSIPMMCLQTPGSFLWSGSLAARVGWEGWSTWGVCLVTGTLQGILLTMGVVFEVQSYKKFGVSAEERDRIHGHGNSGDVNGTEEEDELENESAPLLGK